MGTDENNSFIYNIPFFYFHIDLKKTLSGMTMQNWWVRLHLRVLSF